MLLCKGHGCIKADDRESPCYLQDGLDHRLTGLGIQVIQLGRIIPGKMGAVITVIDVTYLTALMIHPFKDNSCVAPVVVVILNKYPKPAVFR
ncbi:hypothetical protein ES703_67946 [subsurface metagenome]